jgi:phosphoglycerol transferase MdoB-like AlkP superfamily enzyme
MNDYSSLIQIASMFLALLSGIGAVPITGMIKDGLKLNGRWAQFVVVVVAVVFAVLNLIVTGAISPEAFAPERMAELFLAVLVASQAEYGRIKRAESQVSTE